MLDYSEVSENKRVIKTEKSHFEITLNRHSHLWEIKPGSGPVPAALSGGYTSAQIAKTAVQNYLNSRDRKVV